jgi:hypothetical protein
MEKLLLDIHEDVIVVLKKIKDQPNGEVELVIPEGSVLFENSLNLKLLKKEAGAYGKNLIFSTTDSAGNNLLDVLENGIGEGVSSDFVSREVSMDSIVEKKKKFNFSFPNLSFIKKIKLPKLAFKSKAPLIGVGIVVLGIAGYGISRFIWQVPKAEVKVLVNSQPLIKSVEIQVKPGTENNVEDRILAGVIVEAVLTDKKSMEPSGELLVGERAEGTIEVYNYNTSASMDFEDGEELYSVEDDDLFYTLNDDINVPVASSVIDGDGNMITTPGKAEVEVTAVAIGDDYNLDDGENLEFDDFDSSSYSGKVIEDIDGGSSEIVNVVAQVDLDSLSEELYDQIYGEGSSSVAGNLPEGHILINGSIVGSLVTEEFNAEIGEEVDELEVTQTLNFQGLAYKEGNLDEILEDLLKEFIPEGFELSSEEKDTNVEILGNTDATVLNLSQADLQVTIKAFVIPEIDEEGLKNDLVGVSISEAEKILGKVRNVKTYEINVDPNIPLFKKMPGNIENISLKVERE